MRDAEREFREWLKVNVAVTHEVDGQVTTEILNADATAAKAAETFGRETEAAEAEKAEAWARAGDIAQERDAALALLKRAKCALEWSLGHVEAPILDDTSDLTTVEFDQWTEDNAEATVVLESIDVLLGKEPA